MSELYHGKTSDEMMSKVLSNEGMKKKMLKDFGYEDRAYTDQEMKYITYAIINFGGMEDKVKASKALYLVTEIAKFAEKNNYYEELGRFTLEILKEHGVMNK